jgi:hypothetical protein
MNSIELSLVELVDIAETPLYSAYCWLRRHVSGPMSLSGFLEMVDGLVQRDVIRLWSVDIDSGNRTELFQVPASLGGEYLGLEELDDRYDPFGLSISTGAAAHADITEDLEWDFDLNSRDGTFSLRFADGLQEAALATIARLLPDLILEPVTVTKQEVAGRATHRRHEDP